MPAHLNFECLNMKKKNPSKQLETVVTKIRKYDQVYFLNDKCLFLFLFHNKVKYSASLQFILLNRSSKLSTLQKAALCVICQRAVRMTPNLKRA